MIIGTAGHIDHGKTSLVRCLTGIDTDRLPEEKRRGMTIDLGFAHLKLEGIGEVGIVDVPGHERFVRNMVAGATGIDLALLVVAADDGVMPQTREHLDIMTLLGIRRAVVALNKTDITGPERVAEVAGEVRALLDGTPFTAAPIMPVSARTGTGIDALRGALADALRDDQERKRSGFFRLPLDRAFVMPGHGLVVTGTVASGQVRKEDRVRLLPGGKVARVRGIQVHGRPAESAAAGSRCALNLAGVEKASARRGAMAVDAKLERVASVVDAVLTLAQHVERVPGSHQRVRLHTGTAEVLARVVWLADAPGTAGAQAFAQLRLEEPVAALYGDRFILRSEEALRTLGGGIVLDPFAARRGARRADRAARLERLRTLDPDQALTAWMESRGAAGWLLAELAERVAEPAERVAERLARRSDVVREVLGDMTWVVLARDLDTLMRDVASAAADFLVAHPRMTAAPLATLQSLACPRLHARAFRAVCLRLVSARWLEQTADGMRPAGHRQRFTAAEQHIAEQVESLLACTGATPPKLEVLAKALGMPANRLERFLGELARAGNVVKIASEVYLTQHDLERFRTLARRLLAERGQITLGEFRDAAGIGRGLALQLLETFDRLGLTRRNGDLRVAAPPTTLRSGSAHETG